MSCGYISNWDELFMRHAYLIARKSKDPRTHIGAVLVKNKTIFSEGYNGFPREVKDDEERYNNRETKLKFVAHAELNAIINAARIGVSTWFSTMYTQSVPCNECAKAIINAGIVMVTVHSAWKDSLFWKEPEEITKTMFREAGINIKIFERKLGLRGFCDGQSIRV